MTTSSSATVFRAALRRDLPTFVERVFASLDPGTTFEPNWSYEHICWALSRVMSGEIRRLIINVPPRSGKSIIASVSWPMFVLGHDPTQRIICVSHTEDLARKFSIDRRAVAQHSWYQHLFPTMRLVGPKPRDLELITTRRGGCLATGVGGGILGRGADIIVVDDPIKALDALSKPERRRVTEFYDNTLITRFNDKRSGAVVIIMQRLHQDDLVGYLLDRDEWEVISLPAIASSDTVHQLSADPNDVHRRSVGDLLHPIREPREILEQIRRAQGSLNFEAQYQQQPVPAGGNVIKREWLRFYSDNERPDRFDRIVISWDTASTLGEANDYSVGTVWGSAGLDYYLLDVYRARVEVPELRRAIIELNRHWGPNAVVIERTELGRALLHDLRRTEAIRPVLMPAFYDKEARLLAQSARFEAGQVHLPDEAPWLAVYMDELLAFPNGRHDDQVDSTSQALRWLTGQRPIERPFTRRNIERR
jgi:predicted phage terminase large subunit-like protein